MCIKHCEPFFSYSGTSPNGEIRYKTSIDVEGDRLTLALIKRLVYTNVIMMDEYLPGIQAVLAGEDPTVAVRALEQPTPSSPNDPTG